MPQRRATIGSANGLHARPASQFVEAAAATGLSVLIGREGQTPVVASSILTVMSLGLTGRDDVVLAATTTDADGVLDDLDLTCTVTQNAPFTLKNGRSVTIAGFKQNALRNPDVTWDGVSHSGH